MIAVHEVAARLRLVSYVVLLAALAAGLAALHSGLWVALLPAAVVLGWAQVGGP